MIGWWRRLRIAMRNISKEYAEAHAEAERQEYARLQRDTVEGQKQKFFSTITTVNTIFRK